MRLAFALNRKCEFKLEKVEMAKPAHIIWKDIKLRRMINDVEILYNFQSIYAKRMINSVSYSSAEFQNVDSSKIRSFWKNIVFWLYGSKVLQLMSAGACLENFGEKYLVFILNIVRTLLKTNELYLEKSF